VYLCQTDWGRFEKYKRLGNISFLLLTGFIISFILCAGTIPYAYYTKLNTSWYLVAGTEIFFLNLLSLFLVIKLHLRDSVDNFGMRKELTAFALLTMITSAIGSSFFFLYEDHYIKLWNINIPIHFVALFINLYQFSFLGKEIKNNGQENDNENINKYENIKLIDILQHPAGVNEFARFLIGEFSLEHLLFLIEVSQYRQQFEKPSTVQFKLFLDIFDPLFVYNCIQLYVDCSISKAGVYINI